MNLESLYFPRAFSGDKFLVETFILLVKKHKIKHIVETGTCKGNTSAALAVIMKDNGDVTTIEASNSYFVLGDWLKKFTNVKRVLGDSPEWIEKNAKKLEGPLLFFLDAHWEIPTPTPKELDAIWKNGLKPVIVIHDFKVPDRPDFGFDTYSDWTYDIDHVMPYLEKIYGRGNYAYSYNSKAVGVKRGVLIVEPI